MLVTQHVDIPEGLLLAQEQGRLVVFIGAGASVAPPSCLPMFDALAEAIAADADHPFTAADRREPSKFLGRLADQGIAVHQLAHARVSSSPGPNRVHEALVSLFPSCDALRIVTTNWDRHLTVAAAAKFGRRPVVYHAPALPLGRDFTGIVHLHGCLDQQPRELIMTEADFGRAYLTDAYCARFVHEMFRSYTVLFVGYSNNDVIMYHLGRGLPPRAEPRYGFIADAPSAEWQALRISSIYYPSDYGHAALEEGLVAWSWLVQSGHLAYERRVMDLLASAAAPRTGLVEDHVIAWEPADESFMRRVIADPQRVDLFTTHADANPALLEWIQDTAPFQELHSDVGRMTPVSHSLGAWFADRFAAELPEIALAVVNRHGGRLSPQTAGLVTGALTRAAPTAIARWLPALFASQASVSMLGLLLGSFRDDTYLDVGILLLDHLVTPRPVLRTTINGDGSANLRVDIVLTGEEFELREAWTEFFTPRLDRIAATLLPAIERHLRSTHLFLRADNRAGRERDILSLTRSSVSTDQDEPSSDIDLLIDIARDALSALGRVSPRHAQATTDTWVADDTPLLRRLAIHCRGQRADISSDTLIEWLIEVGALYDAQARPEVYDLLAAHIPHAYQVRDRLLTAVLAGPDPSFPSERRHWPVMSLLAWLVARASDFTTAALHLADLQRDHPDFTPSPRANRIFTFTMTAVGEHSPRTVEQLHQMTSRQDVDWLRDYQGEADPEGPNRAGLLWNIAQAAVANITWSLALAAKLVDAADWDSDLWPMVFQGWTQTLPTAPQEQVIEILKLLNPSAQYPTLFARTTSLLAAITSRQDISADIIDRCERLANALWSAAREHNGAGLPELEPREDRLFVWAAVGHWIGDLTTAFLQIAALRWHADHDSWTGLPPALRDALEHLLKVDFVDRLAVLAVAARSLALLCTLDQQWTTAHIAPNFDPGQSDDPDHQRALAAWQGFLTHPAWNERVLAILEPHFAEAFDAMTGDLRKAAVDAIVNIAVGAPAHDEFIDRMISALISRADDDERATWARSIGWLLRKISAESAQAAWDSWIPTYWTRRNAGIPRSLSPAEAEEMLVWTTTAGHRFPEAVNLLTSSTTTFDRAYLFFKYLADHRLLRDHPLEASRLVAFVLAHCTITPSPVCDAIGSVLQSLIGIRAEESSTYLTSACDDARRLGCIGAREWLRRLEEGESN